MSGIINTGNRVSVEYATPSQSRGYALSIFAYIYCQILTLLLDNTTQLQPHKTSASSTVSGSYGELN